MKRIGNKFPPDEITALTSVGEKVGGRILYGW